MGGGEDSSANSPGTGPRRRHLDRVGDVRDRLLGACRRHIPEASEVALLGFPNHGNVGDSSIWLGQLALLSELGFEAPCYTASAGSYSPRALERHAPPGAPILLSGGGNFGDLWPAEQRFRERVLRDFPARPIVQLPQSIWFRREENRARARALLNGHPRFTLLVRDEESRARARYRLGVPASLCPDVAFALGPLDLPPRGDGPDVLWLARTDKESASEGDDEASVARLRAEGVELELRDWRHDPDDLVLALLTRIHPRMPSRPPLLRRWAEQEMARRRTTYGLGVLAGAGSVITDRLHGHILCVLAGVPHVLVDNSYGKLSSFYRTWTSGFASAEFASDAREAVDRAVEWVSSPA